MKLDRYGGWLALAANLGVVAGLVLLAVELRQNTQVVRAQAVTNLMTGLMSAETAFMGEDTAAAYVVALDSPETLTGEEIVKVWAVLNVTMMAVQQTHSMYALGLATEESWNTAVDWASGSLNFPFSRMWWRQMKNIFPSDLVEEIDAALVKGGGHDEQSMLEALRNGARELAAK